MECDVSAATAEKLKQLKGPRPAEAASQQEEAVASAREECEARHAVALTALQVRLEAEAELTKRAEVADARAEAAGLREQCAELRQQLHNMRGAEAEAARPGVNRAADARTWFGPMLWASTWHAALYLGGAHRVGNGTVYNLGHVESPLQKQIVSKIVKFCKILQIFNGLF